VSRLRQETAIRNLLLRAGPWAMGKIGTSELLMLEYASRWIRLPWPPNASWHRPTARLHNTGGLFPVTKQIFERFVAEFPDAVRSLDLVAQWQTPGTYEAVLEKNVLDRLCPQAIRAGFYFLRILNPRAPWLDDLARFRWLVIHPFEKTIRTQLPHLHELGVYADSVRPVLKQKVRDTLILAPPQFSYMTPPRHRDWFKVLAHLQQEMEKKMDDFDIALVGAGAWSLPLVAHAKKIGKKGMHLGGSLQLMFGIKGGRFDCNGIYNPRWIRPLPEDRPANCHLMENGAYW